MSTLAWVLLGTTVTFILTLMIAASIWKCCPCVDGIPDCSERERVKAEIKSRKQEMAA